MTKPSRMNALPLLLASALCSLTVAGNGAAPVRTEDVQVGFLPLGWVAPAVRKALSPQGTFRYVSVDGPVRITDTPANIEAARRVLTQLEMAPALVPVELNFLTFTERTVRRPAPRTPSEETGIPVPSRYDPPRIIANGSGGVTVIPSTPHFDRPRPVGSDVGSEIVERRQENAVARRVSASLVVGKPVDVPVVREVTDIGALRALALKSHAIDNSEPAWSAAGTELRLSAELAGGALILNITPQIVIAGVQGEAPRRIPLLSYAAAVPIIRGKPAVTGALKNAGVLFYRTFLGAPQIEDGAATALKVAASVNYVGGPPR